MLIHFIVNEDNRGLIDSTLGPILKKQLKELGIDVHLRTPSDAIAYTHGKADEEDDDEVPIEKPDGIVAEIKGIKVDPILCALSAYKKDGIQTPVYVVGDIALLHMCESTLLDQGMTTPVSRKASDTKTSESVTRYIQNAAASSAFSTATKGIKEQNDIIFGNGLLTFSPSNSFIQGPLDKKSLSRNASNLLLFLISRPIIFSREQIREVLGKEVDLRSVDSLIKQLRIYFLDCGINPGCIVTHYGEGYRFDREKVIGRDVDQKSVAKGITLNNILTVTNNNISISGPVRTVPISRSLYLLLQHFIQNPSEIVTREEINHVLERNAGPSAARQLIKRLQDSLTEAGVSPDCIYIQQAGHYVFKTDPDLSFDPKTRNLKGPKGSAILGPLAAKFIPYLFANPKKKMTPETIAAAIGKPDNTYHATHAFAGRLLETLRDIGVAEETFRYIKGGGYVFDPSKLEFYSPATEDDLSLHRAIEQANQSETSREMLMVALASSSAVIEEDPQSSRPADGVGIVDPDKLKR